MRQNDAPYVERSTWQQLAPSTRGRSGYVREPTPARRDFRTWPVRPAAVWQSRCSTQVCGVCERSIQPGDSFSRRTFPRSDSFQPDTASYSVTNPLWICTDCRPIFDAQDTAKQASPSPAAKQLLAALDGIPENIGEIARALPRCPDCDHFEGYHTRGHEGRYYCGVCPMPEGTSSFTPGPGCRTFTFRRQPNDPA